uniref:Uncharacterized protein n=1 Tax=Hippocampus comes TaxID=109280 RepID=A0A3Q2ZIB5_HIPCM
MDAEAAIVSATAQLLSFKDILKVRFSTRVVSRVLQIPNVSSCSSKDAPSSAVNRQRTVKHRRLLLQKMEDFRQINQLVRQRLNQLLDEEVGCHSFHLQENIKSALNIAKSAEGARARIQGQLRNKEAENNRLTVQVRTLERTLTQHKAELDDLKASLTALMEQTSQEKEALKKASRVHKQKAERFEASLEKSLTQLQDKVRPRVHTGDSLGFPVAKTLYTIFEHRERKWAKGREDREKELEDRMKERKQQEDKEREWAKGREEREKELEDRMKERKEQENKEREWVKEREEREKDLEDRMKERKEQEHREREWVKGKEPREKESEARMKERKEQENKEREWSKEREAREKELEDRMKERKEQANKEREWVRQELQGRVEELQHLPKTLKETELKLLACQEKLQTSERKCSEQAEDITKLQYEVCQQEGSLASSRIPKTCVFIGDANCAEV